MMHADDVTVQLLHDADDNNFGYFSLNQDIYHASHVSNSTDPDTTTKRLNGSASYLLSQI